MSIIKSQRPHIEQQWHIETSLLPVVTNKLEHSKYILTGLEVLMGLSITGALGQLMVILLNLVK